MFTRFSPCRVSLATRVGEKCTRDETVYKQMCVSCVCAYADCAENSLRGKEGHATRLAVQNTVRDPRENYWPPLITLLRERNYATLIRCLSIDDDRQRIIFMRYVQVESLLRQSYLSLRSSSSVFFFFLFFFFPFSLLASVLARIFAENNHRPVFRFACSFYFIFFLFHCWRFFLDRL